MSNYEAPSKPLGLVGVVHTYEELKLSRKVDKIKFIKIIKEKNKENEEQIKKQGANIRNITGKPVKNEITGSDKLQNNEKTIEELKEMTSIQGIKKIPAEKKVMFFQKLAKIKTKEELKNFCDEYDILLNLQLFKI